MALSVSALHPWDQKIPLFEAGQCSSKASARFGPAEDCSAEWQEQIMMTPNVNHTCVFLILCLHISLLLLQPTCC